MIYIMVQNYNLSELKDKSLFSLTVSEFISLQEQVNSKCKESAATMQTEAKKYVYGYKGIAELFHCSNSKAARLKLSGAIDGAITQVGKSIIVDAELAMQLAGKKKGGRR